MSSSDPRLPIQPEKRSVERHLVRALISPFRPAEQRVPGQRRIRWSLSPLQLLSLLIAIAMLLPLTYLVVRAAGVGSEELLRLTLRSRTFGVVVNSGVLAVGVTLASALLAVPLAWLTVRTDLPGRRIWTILITMPLVVPSYVGGFALVAMLGPRGMVQEMLSPLGIERLPSIYGFPGALWALTLFTYPYLYLSVRAGLSAQDPAIDEAARCLGCGPWSAFFQVTLPNLRPSITAGALLVALYTLSDFGAVSLLRYNSLTRAIYVQYLSSFDRSLASVLSLLLVGMTILLLIAERRSRGRHRYYRSGVGVLRRQRFVALGAWKWPALILCGSVVTAALVIPSSVVLFWLIRGLIAGESLLPVWSATVNTVSAGILAAAAATLCALPVAYVAVRMPGRLASFVSGAVYVGYGLPGIVIALSLVFFGANYLIIVYQTLSMLIFAYVVRFLPQAFGSVQSSLLQMSPRLEEAGRSLGLSPRRVFWRISAPLLRPGILAGLALVFLTTIKELPATLLLSPTGFDTLATQIWAATGEAFFARAAAPALLLLVVSALSIVLVLSQESIE